VSEIASASGVSAAVAQGVWAGFWELEGGDSVPPLPEPPHAAGRAPSMSATTIA